jgi:16S rRNA (cytidine1402-2'-O)-methyltransferase
MSETQRKGRLYIIATPIGNLEDITLRALHTLQGVDSILCEDTRVAKKLLVHYQIHKPLSTYHAHSKINQVEKILADLGQGKQIALISDAGTPTISDPGVMLVAQVREALGELVEVVPLPGPSAVVTALSACGVPSSAFTFLGFLPHKKGKETLLKEIVSSKRTYVFYESPHRIIKTLTALAEYLQDSKRRVVIARELTKIYEQFVSGTAVEVEDYFVSHPDKVKGEFVVIVEGA